MENCSTTLSSHCNENQILKTHEKRKKNFLLEFYRILYIGNMALISSSDGMWKTSKSLKKTRIWKCSVALLTSSPRDFLSHSFIEWFFCMPHNFSNKLQGPFINDLTIKLPIFGPSPCRTKIYGLFFLKSIVRHTSLRPTPT